MIFQKMSAQPSFLLSLPLHGQVRTSQPARCALRRPVPVARLDASGAEYIRLESFLKLQGAADTGGQAKQIVKSGVVRVNGEVDTRRGRKLRQGDVVEFDEFTFPVDFTAESGSE